MGSMFQTYETTLEVYIGNQIVNKQRLVAPKEIIMANFMQLSEQIGNDNRPMKIKITRPEVIWDNFEKKQKTLANAITFKNNAMISLEAEAAEEESNQ